MRILWFTNNSSCYSDNTGGGWISSLEIELRKEEKVQLGVCFYADKEMKVHKGDVTYYLLPRPHKKFSYTVKQILNSRLVASLNHEKIAIPPLLRVIEDYRPDIIHVFGSEDVFGLLSYYTDIPIVLHIQGVLSSCLNAFLPPFVSWQNYLFASKRIKSILGRVSEKIAWERNSIAEKRMLQNIKYIMGRTEWDKRVSEVLSPRACYYHCDEILRDHFYGTEVRKIPPKPILVTTISPFLYKGYDVILKTAQILKFSMGVEFEWRVYGDVFSDFIEKQIGISHKFVNVRLMGKASAEEIKDAILNSTAYVHTSYIENSPNAICEAQLLGCACIATDVGGVSSLIENNKTGLLVPANDIYQLAHQIAYLFRETLINEAIGRAAQDVAQERHNKQKVVQCVIEIYEQILENNLL